MGFSSFQTYGSSVAISKIISPYFTIRNFTVSGLSSDGYEVYTFNTVTQNYHSILYYLKEPKTLYIMAVGGGGNGGKDYSGGGGGGGVVLATVVLPVGSDTINIPIRDGQSRGFRRSATGGTTYVSFVKNTSLNLIAGGGGNGQ
jgi:hypothetical protein